VLISCNAGNMAPFDVFLTILVFDEHVFQRKKRPHAGMITSIGSPSASGGMRRWSLV
jgi:hypothetical protein